VALITLSTTALLAGVDGQQLARLSPSNGSVVLEDTDVSTYPNAVVWTSTAQNLYPQDYPLVPYYDLHTYDFVIAYLNPWWQLCAQNITNGSYECRAVSANS
jgi:hypothetical protein